MVMSIGPDPGITSTLFHDTCPLNAPLNCEIGIIIEKKRKEKNTKSFPQQTNGPTYLPTSLPARKPTYVQLNFKFLIHPTFPGASIKVTLCGNGARRMIEKAIICSGKLCWFTSLKSFESVHGLSRDRDYT